MGEIVNWEGLFLLKFMWNMVWEVDGGPPCVQQFNFWIFVFGCGREDVKNSILFYPNERNSILIRTLYIGSHVNYGPKNWLRTFGFSIVMNPDFSNQLVWITRCGRMNVKNSSWFYASGETSQSGKTVSIRSQVNYGRRSWRRTFGYSKVMNSDFPK